jgi:hypothetical protein
MPSTGRAEVARQVGGIGAQLGALGTAIEQKQAMVRLDEFKLRVEERMLTLGKEVNNEPDEDKYAAMLEKAFSELSAKVPKGMAGPVALSYLKKEKAAQLQSVNEAMDRRVESKWRGTWEIRRQKAITTGNLLPFARTTKDGLDAGYIDGGQAEKKLTDTAHDAEKWDAQQIALGPNPEKILNKYTTAQELQKDYPTLTGGDLQDIRQNAQGQVRNLETLKLQKVSRHRVRMAEDAQNLTISPLEQFAEIQKLGLEPDEENALFDEFTKARNMILSGLGNPYTKTMNHSRLKELRDAARAGVLTEKQISEAEGKDISLSDAEDLRKRVANGGTAQNFRDSDMATTFINRLKADELLDSPLAKEQGLRWLEAWSKANSEASQREADEQAIRVYERVVREDVAGTLPTTADELRAMRLEPERIRKGMEELDRIDLSKILPIVRTDADYAKLPSGTVFRDENGRRYRKP